MQNAMSADGILANCNPQPLQFKYNSLFFKDYFLISAWHARCILSDRANPFQTPTHVKVNEMNMTLSLLNAAALVALVAFHFQDNASQTENVAQQAQPHYLAKQAPRYATMQSHRSDAMLATDTDDAIPVDRTERWVF